MDTVRQDVRYALRMLWKHRFATFVCAGALALGIGANTAIFSMAEAFLLHPVPLNDVNRIVALVDSQPRHNVEKTSVAPATYLEWQTQAHSFEQVGAYSWDGVNFTGDGTPQKIQDYLVTTNFFRYARRSAASRPRFSCRRRPTRKKSGTDSQLRALGTPLRVGSQNSRQDREG